MIPNNFEESILKILSSLLITQKTRMVQLKIFLSISLSIAHSSLKIYLLYVEAISSICLKTS